MRNMLTMMLFSLIGSQLQAEVADGYLPTWVANRTATLNQRFSTAKMDSIGWARDIGQALEIAEKYDRPVFLFTLDGHMNTGRC